MRIAATLTAILRAQQSRAPLPRLRLLVFFFLLFATLFAAIFLPLRFFLPPPAEKPSQHHQNVKRVRDGLQPLEFWPALDSRAHALVAAELPLQNPLSLQHLRAKRPASRPAAVTIVAACRDRTAFLQTALPGWLAVLRPLDDIVLVDWGTRPPDHVPLEEVVRAASHPQLTLVSLRQPGPWVLSRAYNLAFALATGEWILKLDCDTEVRDNFFQRHPLHQPHRLGQFFYRFNWKKAANENERHLSGVFLARAEHIAQVHGYDERISTYGWDDSDLYSRLHANAVPHPAVIHALDIQPATLSHMAHGDDLRSQNQRLVMGPTLETQLNSQAVSALPAWHTVANQQKTMYAFSISSRDAHYIVAKPLNAPKPLLKQLSSERRHAIIEEGTNRLLHDDYGFPWNVLSEINRSRAELARSLAVLGKLSGSETFGRFIFAEVGGSVPQRLLAMSSALALAITHERPLFIAWSAGTRAEPTPRVTDFYDVDNSGFLLGDSLSAASGRRKSARVYQIGRWKCRSSLEVCAQSDAAFNAMVEFRSGAPGDEIKAAQNVLDVLAGKVAGKRNVLLRLEGAFPLQSVHDRQRALLSLTPSLSLAAHVNKLGGVKEHVGVYVGARVRQKSVVAMAKRLRDHTGADAKFFVSGANRDVVHEARMLLSASEKVAAAAKEPVRYGATQEIRDTVRDIGELYALASCNSMVNDGRPPAAVLEVLSLLKEASAPR